MRKLVLVFVSICAIGLAGLAGTAAADPINKNSFMITLHCDGQTVEVVAIGEGQFSPAHVLDSTALFIPQSFDLVITFTTPEGETFTEVEQVSKANVEQGQPLVTCSVNETQTFPEGTFHIEGMVTGFFTP